jgi:hypothetical protein
VLAEGALASPESLPALVATRLSGAIEHCDLSGPSAVVRSRIDAELDALGAGLLSSLDGAPLASPTPTDLGPVAAALGEAARAATLDAPLRLRVAVAPPLASIPWELLAVPLGVGAAMRLATHPAVAMARQVGSRPGGAEAWTSSDPRASPTVPRATVATSRARVLGLRDLSGDGASLAEAIAATGAEVSTCSTAELDADHADVFLVLAHGYWCEGLGYGGHLDDAVAGGGEAVDLAASAFARRLAGARVSRLVALLMCQSAGSLSPEAAGDAPTVQAAVAELNSLPVLGVTGSMRADVLVELGRAVMSALARGLPVDIAVQTARRHLERLGESRAHPAPAHVWFRPVLALPRVDGER